MSEQLIKFLGVDGRGRCSGYLWPLPKDDQPGEWVKVEEELIPCAVGVHLCRPGDAMLWFDATAYEAECRGERIDVDDPLGQTKVVVAEARLLRRYAAWDERAMRLFGCDCAERVLPLCERDAPGDARPRDAIAVARRFANGAATRKELDAAWEAARAAAWDASCGVAWDAARAAARSAAREAVRAAVRAAAKSAARAVAWDAGRNFARDIAWDAAWEAERSWQSLRLLSYLDGTVQPLTSADLIVPREVAR